MERTAYGFLGLKPWEFGKLTPKQFYLMVEGYKEKDEAEWRRTAQHAAWIMNSLGNKVTVDKLLRKPPSREEVEESKALFNQAPDRR